MIFTCCHDDLSVRYYFHDVVLPPLMRSRLEPCHVNLLTYYSECEYIKIKIPRVLLFRRIKSLYNLHILYIKRKKV